MLHFSQAGAPEKRAPSPTRPSETHDAIHMRTFALAALAFGVALNFFLGYCGQSLADSMRVRLQTYGAKVPAVAELALALPPWFYVVGVAALLSAGLGLGRVLANRVMLYAAFAFLVLDIILLFASHFAFTYVAIRM